jgi:hypothetical protein
MMLKAGHAGCSHGRGKEMLTEPSMAASMYNIQYVCTWT